MGARQMACGLRAQPALLDQGVECTGEYRWLVEGCVAGTRRKRRRCRWHGQLRRDRRSADLGLRRRVSRALASFPDHDRTRLACALRRGWRSVPCSREGLGDRRHDCRAEQQIDRQRPVMMGVVMHRSTGSHCARASPRQPRSPPPGGRRGRSRGRDRRRERAREAERRARDHSPMLPSPGRSRKPVCANSTVSAET